MYLIKQILISHLAADTKESYSPRQVSSRKKLVPPTGFEPVTSALGKCVKAAVFRFFNVFPVHNVLKKASNWVVCCRNAASEIDRVSSDLIDDYACGGDSQNRSAQPG